MARAGRQVRSYAIPGRRVVFGTYAISNFIVCIAIILWGHRIPPLTLGVSLGTYLFAVGVMAFLLLRRAGRRRTHWHNVMPCYLSVQDAELRVIETNERFKRDFGDITGEYCHWDYNRSEEP